MDKNSKILFTVFFIAVFAAIGTSFYKYYILKDFYILAETACDPTQERCFERGCYSASDPGCVEGGEFSVYCKLIKKNASAIQDCDPKDPNCGALDCKKEEGCTEILCDEKNKGENYTCNDPKIYIQNLEQGN